MVGGTKECGAGGHSGDEADGGGNTRKVTSTAANKAGAGGTHGAKTELRGGVKSRQENRADNYLGVRGNKGGAQGLRSGPRVLGSGGQGGGGGEASGVAENLQGYRQGVGGGVESPQGIDAPVVAELPWGDKTPRVTTAGEGVSGEDRQGRGGD